MFVLSSQFSKIVSRECMTKMSFPLNTLQGQPEQRTCASLCIFASSANCQTKHLAHAPALYNLKIYFDEQSLMSNLSGCWCVCQTWACSYELSLALVQGKGTLTHTNIHFACKSCTLCLQSSPTFIRPNSSLVKHSLCNVLYNVDQTCPSSCEIGFHRIFALQCLRRK